MRRKEKKLKSKYENNFNNFDWEFKDNEEKYLDMDFYKN